MVFLVVDDSRVTRKIIINDISKFRERDGYKDEFVQAGNGREALEELSKHQVDVIVCDWNMPEVDGLEFIKAARQLDAHKETPILMCTSESARSQVVEAFSAGVTDYILKPLSGNKVWDKVSKYCE